MSAGVRRLTPSKLSIAQHCTYFLREDVPLEKFKETWATRLGNAFHEACEVYPNVPDLNAIAINWKDTKPESAFKKHLANRYAMWAKWAAVNYAPSWRHELSLGYDPITGAARILEGRFPKTEPGEIMGRLDMVDPWRRLFTTGKRGPKPSPCPPITRRYGHRLLWQQRRSTLAR